MKYLYSFGDDKYGWSKQYTFTVPHLPGPDVTTKIIAYGGKLEFRVLSRFPMKCSCTIYHITQSNLLYWLNSIRRSRHGQLMANLVEVKWNILNIHITTISILQFTCSSIDLLHSVLYDWFYCVTIMNDVKNIHVPCTCIFGRTAIIYRH